MAILEEALALSRDQTAQTYDVWEALRTLEPHCSERWPLRQFWDAAGADFGQLMVVADEEGGRSVRHRNSL
jgi:hypothetical protein